MRARSTALLTILAAAALLGAACNETERVDLTFRPDPGSAQSYEITVDSAVTTTLAGPPEATRDRIDLRAEQTVRSRGPEGVALDIAITSSSERRRVFDVRLDPAGGGATIRAVEGLPVEALGELGPSRLILLATGLLPHRALKPGAAWSIERALELPEGDAVLTGRGRLAGLRADGDVETARVAVTTTLPVVQEMTLAQGHVTLTGEERTTATLEYDVRDGTLWWADAVTTGEFTLVVTAPGGLSAAPVEGKLTVRVESTTRRVPGATSA